jgi:ParB family chromosome partitioning protein
METIQMIAISKIVKNPYQPREIFDEEKLQELSESIKKNGILQPIIVRESSIIGYEILAGERRFRAAQLAGMIEIPAIIRNLTDDEMMTLSILENLQRDDLTVLEEAKSLQNLVTKQGLTHEQIAKKLGKSRPYVTNAIRLLNLPKLVLQMLNETKISQAHARLLLNLETPKQQINWAKRVYQEQLSVRKLEKLLIPSNLKHSKKSKNIFIKETEENLTKLFGNSVQIKSKKIEIPYEDLEDLNRLIDILTQK